MSTKTSMMERISQSTRSLTTGVDTKDVEHWVTIYIMGRGYRVPADLTIMTAMEFAGYKLIRSVSYTHLRAHET